MELSERPRRSALMAGFFIAGLSASMLAGGARAPAPAIGAVMLARQVHDSMDTVFTRSNQHWDELQGVNTLTQMLGTAKPTQREYLGCLQGEVRGDTLWVDGWQPSREMKQLQFAVDGDCTHVPRFVGTFHTHPYRADLQNLPLKERSLSRQDLETFARAPDLVMMAVWDVDSLDVALKPGPGRVRHPMILNLY